MNKITIIKAIEEKKNKIRGNLKKFLNISLLSMGFAIYK
jgi:hypothetical protein